MIKFFVQLVKVLFEKFEILVEVIKISLKLKFIASQKLFKSKFKPFKHLNIKHNLKQQLMNSNFEK